MAEGAELGLPAAICAVSAEHWLCAGTTPAPLTCPQVSLLLHSYLLLHLESGPTAFLSMAPLAAQALCMFITDTYIKILDTFHVALLHDLQTLCDLQNSQAHTQIVCSYQACAHPHLICLHACIYPYMQISHMLLNFSVWVLSIPDLVFMLTSSPWSVFTKGLCSGPTCTSDHGLV